MYQLLQHVTDRDKFSAHFALTFFVDEIFTVKIVLNWSHIAFIDKS